MQFRSPIFLRVNDMGIKKPITTINVSRSVRGVGASEALSRWPIKGSPSLDLLCSCFEMMGTKSDPFNNLRSDHVAQICFALLSKKPRRFVKNVFAPPIFRFHVEWISLFNLMVFMQYICLADTWRDNSPLTNQ